MKKIFFLMMAAMPFSFDNLFCNSGNRPASVCVPSASGSEFTNTTNRAVFIHEIQYHTCPSASKTTADKRGHTVPANGSLKIGTCACDIRKIYYAHYGPGEAKPAGEEMMSASGRWKIDQDFTFFESAQGTHLKAGGKPKEYERKSYFHSDNVARSQGKVKFSVWNKAKKSIDIDIYYEGRVGGFSCQPDRMRIPDGVQIELGYGEDCIIEKIETWFTDDPKNSATRRERLSSRGNLFKGWIIAVRQRNGRIDVKPEVGGQNISE